MRWSIVGFVFIAGVALGQNAPDPAATIVKIRENAHTYIDRLAVLTCTENTRQTIAIPGVTSTETREDGCDTTGYKLFAVQAVGLAGPRVNPKHASPDWRERLSGASLGTATGFLAALADTNIDTDLRWVRLVTLNGRPAAIFSFYVPEADGYVLADVKRTMRVPYTGRLYADPETGAIMRVEIRCVDIPRDSEYEGADVTVDFGSFTVNGRMVDLPSHSIVLFRMKKGNAANEADYSGYRMAIFSADEQIRFLDEPPEEKKENER